MNMGKNVMTARQVIRQVATTGYKKTSMQSIADALNISRQALYKKFGSKSVCYEWAIHTYLSDMYQRIFNELSSTTQAPMESLKNAFDIFIGESIETVNNTYGTEVLDVILEYTHSSDEDWPLRFRSRLADFLSRHKLIRNMSPSGIAMVLISSGKGLLLQEKSKDQFSKDMEYMIVSLLEFDN